MTKEEKRPYDEQAIRDQERYRREFVDFSDVNDKPTKRVRQPELKPPVSESEPLAKRVKVVVSNDQNDGDVENVSDDSAPASREQKQKTQQVTRSVSNDSDDTESDVDVDHETPMIKRRPRTKHLPPEKDLTELRTLLAQVPRESTLSNVRDKFVHLLTHDPRVKAKILDPPYRFQSSTVRDMLLTVQQKWTVSLNNNLITNNAVWNRAGLFCDNNDRNLLKPLTDKPDRSKEPEAASAVDHDQLRKALVAIAGSRPKLSTVDEKIVWILRQAPVSAQLSRSIFASADVQRLILEVFPNWQLVDRTKVITKIPKGKGKKRLMPFSMRAQLWKEAGFWLDNTYRPHSRVKPLLVSSPSSTTSTAADRRLTPSAVASAGRREPRPLATAAVVSSLHSLKDADPSPPPVLTLTRVSPPRPRSNAPTVASAPAFD